MNHKLIYGILILIIIVLGVALIITYSKKGGEEQRIFNSKEDCESAGIECVEEMSGTGVTGRYIRKGMVLEGEGFFKFLDDPNEACSGELIAVKADMDTISGCSHIEGPGYICTKCGNKICGLGENKCNCPKDCLYQKGQQTNDTFCLKEGETGIYECCEGLTPIPCVEIIDGECWYTFCGNTCTKCGDEDCGLGENICNCPEDCE